jgi:hypothetical protein
MAIAAQPDAPFERVIVGSTRIGVTAPKSGMSANPPNLLANEKRRDLDNIRRTRAAVRPSKGTVAGSTVVRRVNRGQHSLTDFQQASRVALAR